jgi:pyruvate/oxaloacetate carboxyltransferase
MLSGKEAMSKVLDDAILSKKKSDLLSKALKECQTLNAQLSKKCGTQMRIINELESKFTENDDHNSDLLHQACQILGATPANLLDCLHSELENNKLKSKHDEFVDRILKLMVDTGYSPE